MSSTESQNLGKNEEETEMKKDKTLTTTYEGNFQSEGSQFIGNQNFDNTKFESIVFFRVKDHIDILTMFWRKETFYSKYIKYLPSQGNQSLI